MEVDYRSQDPFPSKLDWGPPGTLRAAHRRDIIVVVDVLSFSTTTIRATSRGAIIYPCAKSDSPQQLAHEVKAELAVSRRDYPENGRYSLSPTSFDKIAPGTRVVLPSLNGATCSRCADDAAAILVGAITNASAVADEALRQQEATGRSVTVIACGEREEALGTNGDLRMAIEDYLGAGAILTHLGPDKSPEARLCETAYQNCRTDLAELIWDSTSGRELRQLGYGRDVEIATALDSEISVPQMVRGAFTARLGQ